MSRDAIVDTHREERLALEYIAEAWNSAEDDGVEPRALAHASLFAALTTFVQCYGEEAAAELVRSLPERIRQGDFDLTRTVQ
ncbi:MAG TPA: hypothetical protein PK286_02785 [Devosia sp.]|nr:hypothetical protein [Devosia sp.]